MTSENQTTVQSGSAQPGKSLKKKGSREKASYLIGLIVIFACVYSQYLGVAYGPISGILTVYGVPILVITVLWGTRILRKFFYRTLPALKVGLGYFGAFTVLGMLVSVLILFVLVFFGTNALDLLSRPNPVLNVSPSYAWIMVGVSLLVVGPAEEYIFTGFMFGGLLGIFNNRHWLTLAFASSLLFAGVHLYYALVYGVASLVQFADLVAFGMAMAATYYLSDGNLFVPSLIHGASDATAFIGVATSSNTGTLLRVGMILLGIILAIVLLVERLQRKGKQAPRPVEESMRNA